MLQEPPKGFRVEGLEEPPKGPRWTKYHQSSAKGACDMEYPVSSSFEFMTAETVKSSVCSKQDKKAAACGVGTAEVSTPNLKNP